MIIVYPIFVEGLNTFICKWATPIYQIIYISDRSNVGGVSRTRPLCCELIFLLN